MGAEERRIRFELSQLAKLIYLEIETYYLFAKILLDKAAHFVEHAFGPVRGLSLDSHDKLIRHLAAYVAARGLDCPAEFAAEASALNRRVSHFRDYRIALMASPPPGKSAKSTEPVRSEELEALHSAIRCAHRSADCAL
jgi:hypothetical protein